MMTLKDFCDYIEKNIKRYLPEQYENADIEVQRTVKNNGLVLQGLTIRRPGISITPVYYLENAYERYMSGEGLENTISHVALSYMKYDAEKNSYAKITEKIGSYESAKEYLVASVVNTWRNMDRFDYIPHVEREDLSVIFKIVAASDMSQMATVTVNNQMLEKWGVSIDQLYSDALENTKKISPAVVMSMGNMLANMTGDQSMLMDDIPPEKQMYVVTNEHMNGGAINMFIDEPLAEIAEKLNSDLVVLPSSIHEIICVSVNIGDLDYMETMVRDINMSTVAQEEQLSDSIYYYDKEKHEIMLNQEHERRIEEQEKNEDKKEVAEENYTQPRHRR